MKLLRRLFVTIVLIIAIGATLYVNRVAVLDWVREVSAPELPEAVTYEEIVENSEDVLEEGDDPEVVEEEEAVHISDEPIQEEVAEDIVEEAVAVEPDLVEESEENVLDAEEVVDLDLPSEINLAVPFTSQAPHANWDQPYQDLCEEASVYMVAEYYEGAGGDPILEDVADGELLEIRDFEVGLFGYYESTTAEQVGVFAEMFYGFSSVETIDDPTVDQIKAHLVAGRPVIVPAAGRLLGNPYFTAPGPVYHMLVIRGYTSDGRFITNDPGTKHGEQYLYDFDTIMYAMHDWNEQEITDGKKVVIVIYP